MICAVITWKARGHSEPGKVPPHTVEHTAPPPLQQAVVGGDKSEDVISAASILAKTFRDRLMLHLGRRWPGYGLEEHKGYGTKAHYAALRRLGPCPQHRLTFRGVLPQAAAPLQGSLC